MSYSYAKANLHSRLESVICFWMYYCTCKSTWFFSSPRSMVQTEWTLQI